MPEWGGNHNGGDVRVANDGTLFVTVGDGGGGSPAEQPLRPQPAQREDPANHTRRLGPRGVTRTDDVVQDRVGPAGAAKVCGEIWADGLRNPFRLGFDASHRRKFRINDVGDGTWEEVNDAFAGAHYGWPCREGPAPLSPVPCRTPMTDPVLFYNHSTGCNVRPGRVRASGSLAGSRRRIHLGRLRCGRLFLAQPGETGTPPMTFATGMQLTTDLEFFPSGALLALLHDLCQRWAVHRVLALPRQVAGSRSAGCSMVGPLWRPGRRDGSTCSSRAPTVSCGTTGTTACGRDGSHSAAMTAPAVAAWSAGRLDVFVKGTDGQLWHPMYRRVVTVGGPRRPVERWPGGGGWSAGRLDVFVRAPTVSCGTSGTTASGPSGKPLGGRLTVARRWRLGRRAASTCSSGASTVSCGTAGTPAGGLGSPRRPLDAPPRWPAGRLDASTCS